MPVRRRQREKPKRYRPPLPAELAMFDGACWDAPADDEGGPVWEAEHRAAYSRYLRATEEWHQRHKDLPVDPSEAPTTDAPWCGLFGPHECDIADCNDSDL